MGISSKFGGSQYDGIPEWDIRIGPVPKELVPTVLPQSEFRQLLDLLGEQFIPVNIFVNYTIYSRKDEPTVISTTGSTAILGYSFSSEI